MKKDILEQLVNLIPRFVAAAFIIMGFIDFIYETGLLNWVAAVILMAIGGAFLLWLSLNLIWWFVKPVINLYRILRGKKPITDNPFDRLTDCGS